MKALTKSYSELVKLKTYDDRLSYLMTGNNFVGLNKWGSHRSLNQFLYQSNTTDWKRIRRKVIIRDGGCDLGLPDYPISGRVTVHHINPITEEDIVNRDPKVFDLNNLITVSHGTHMQIHYGNNDDHSKKLSGNRSPNDTIPWR